MNTIIVGLGNRSFSDDGVGLEVAQAIKLSSPRLDATVVEASLSGLDILNLIADYDKAIVIDAIQTNNNPPGTILRFTLDQVTDPNSSIPHSFDIISSINLGKKLGMSLPKEIIIYGIEPCNVDDPKEGCTQLVGQTVSRCAEKIIAEL